MKIDNVVHGNFLLMIFLLIGASSTSIDTGVIFFQFLFDIFSKDFSFAIYKVNKKYFQNLELFITALYCYNRY